MVKADWKAGKDFELLDKSFLHFSRIFNKRALPGYCNAIHTANSENHENEIFNQVWGHLEE